MNVAIIITKAIADQNIKKQLNFKKTTEIYKENSVLSYKNIKLYEIDNNSINCENIDKEISADLFVFATKHRSESGKPSLTCHTPGNWGKADFGGKDNQLCISPAYYLKQFYLKLKTYQTQIDSEITLEVTHHGPYLEKPCMFVEIGSLEKQWSDEKHGKIISESIKEVFTREEKVETCFFIGGGHYNSYANKIMEKTKYAVGHICPKYMLDNLNEDLIKQAMKKTIPESELVVLDWDGMSKNKQRIVKMLESLNIKSKKAKTILKSQ